MTDRRTGWLLYDSAGVTAEMGAGTPLRTERTLAYRAGDLSVDLVLHAATSDLVCLHGQVVRGVPGRAVAGARVTLHTASQPVHTDERGEFCLSTLEWTTVDPLVVTAGATRMTCRIPTTRGVGAC